MQISNRFVFVMMTVLLSAVPVFAQRPGPTSAPTPSAAPTPQAGAQSTAKTLNLNTATVEQLETLPGIGRKTAERIIEYRTKAGSFKKIEELMNVKGIGEKSFLKIKPLVSALPKNEKGTE